jgi:amino acid adenylation domain-containing protein/non-ribosomal peptide synthase protein (TIGR01720 family)
VNATLYHGYGPAETTIGVSHEIYREGHERGAVTIGRPNPNTAIHLLDAWLRPVSVGVPGELYIGGLLLGRGYAAEPRRTAERFVANPFGGPGERLYRTGDLARWRADGVLEFLGRADNQVKIRGMRVELEEIEAALVRHPAVRQAAVRTREGAGGLRLTGYQVAAGSAAPDEAEVRSWLATQLPAHMVPERIVTLDALPMLPSSKVDRAALPTPDAAERTASRAPAGGTETRLAALFAQVLGLPGVGAEEDFFSLGGDSILSIRLVSTARAAGLAFTVRDVFTAPTVAALAPLVSAAETPASAPAPVSRGAELPVSPLQHGLLFQSLADESEADAYIAQLAIRLTGPVDAGRLRGALEAVLRRHASLRASFHHAGRAEPVQIITDEVRLPWAELDLAGEPGPEAERRWREERDRRRAARFALDRAPLLNAVLARFGAGDHRLLLTNHHLLFDGWSLPLLVNDLLAAYADGTLPPADGQYPAFLDWLAARDRPAAEAAWRAALDGVPGPTLLADRREAPYRPSERYGIALGPDLTARLTRLARRNGVTPHTVLQGAWGLLLGLLTGEPDVLFGSTVSGRPADLPGAEQTVGLFINTVPARVTARPGASFAELLRDLRARQAALLDHQHLGLAGIQRAAGLGELFDTLLVFENYPVSPAALDEAAARAGLSLAGFDSADDTHYPLTLLVAPGDDLRLTLEHRPGVFAADRVRALGDRLHALLAWCVAHPDLPLARLDPLLPGERANWAEPPTADDEDLLAGFDRAVRRAPDRVAVRAGAGTLTYAELDTRVRRVAGVLQERGAGPEKIVGLSLPRGPELVIAVLATLRAGAAFLPLDPGQPAARLKAMAGEAKPVTVLTAADVTGARPRHEFTPVAVDPRCPACLTYTSGSTGVPKGVLLTRAGLHNRLAGMAAQHGFTDADVVVHKAPAGVDVAVWELVLPFLAGARLVLARPGGHRDPGYLVELIREHGVTVVDFVPSMLRAFLAEPGVTGCTSLRRVLCGGEELPADLARRCAELLGGAELHNLYGPTEATIDVTAARVTGRPGDAVPIGRAESGVRLRILDAALRPVPPGVPGELYLGGVQLARGYHGRPGLTASRFVADPAGGGERLYRTGDVVRALPDGTLFHLGRDDEQVKIRGLRVEPGEAAAALAALDGVAEAVVVPRPDGPSGTWLVAYVVGANGPVDPERLRAAVAEVLPDQLVPGAVVPLEALPVTAAGKLDHRALPAPVRPDAAGGRAPDGPVEARLCALFAEVLGLESVSADGNFFALGGDSISALRLTGLARAAGLRCTPRQVFEEKTPAALARVATGVLAAEDAGSDGTGDIPLTPIMRRLLERGGPIAAFRQSVLLRTPAGLTGSRLAAGLRAVLAAHDALRARLVRTPEPLLRVGPGEPDVTPRRIDGVPDDARLAELAEQAARELDPEAGRMVSAVWCDAGPSAPGRLLLTIHHLVVDGVSWRVLLDDLAAACQGTPVAPAATSFRAWSTGLRRAAPALAGQLPVWRAMLSGPPSRLVRRPLTPDRDVLGATERVEVRAPAALTKAVLTTLPQALRARTQDVLLAALVVALARAGEPDPLLELEGHGREEELIEGVDLSRTVGWFTTAFPVRFDVGGLDTDAVLAGGPAAGALVRKVGRTLRGLPHRGAGYGVLRDLAPEAAGELPTLPEPLIGFNYLGRFDARADGDWSLVPGALAGGGDPGMPVDHALDVNVLVDEDGLRASWTHLPELIGAADTRRAASTWLAALRGFEAHARRPDAAAPAAEDFGMVRVSAGQLDRLRARLEGR